MKIIFVLAVIQLLQIKGAFGVATADVSCQLDVNGDRSIHIQLTKDVGTGVNIVEAYAFNKKASCSFTIDGNGGATIDIDLTNGYLSQRYEDCGIVEDPTIGVSNIFKFDVLSSSVAAPIITSANAGAEVYVYAIVCDFTGVTNTATVNGIIMDDSALASGTVTVANPNPILQLIDSTTPATVIAGGQTLDLVAIPSIQIEVIIDTSTAVAGMKVVQCTAYAGADTTGQSLRLCDRDGCGTDQYATAIGIPVKDTNPVFPDTGYSVPTAGKYSAKSRAFSSFKFVDSTSISFECVVIMCKASEVAGVTRTGNCAEPTCTARKRRQALETDYKEMKTFATFEFNLNGPKRGRGNGVNGVAAIGASFTGIAIVLATATFLSSQ